MPKTSTSMKPGETRNPNGRPKKDWSLIGALNEYLSELDPTTKKVRRDMLIESTFKSAVRGEAVATRLIWNYLEGMPKQKIETDIGINNFRNMSQEQLQAIINGEE